jgi:iron(III) transport system substrate-binding protein
MKMHGDDSMAKAYQDLTGKPVEPVEGSATASWVKAFAQNHPIQVDTDESVAEAVGAAGQKEPPVGLVSPSMFRHNADSGYKLGLCTGLKPWAGSTYAKSELISAKTKSPNAARLFVYYSLTEPALKSLIADSNIPTNKAVDLPSDSPSGVLQHVDELLAYDLSTSLADWDARQDWSDFWTEHHR